MANPESSSTHRRTTRRSALQLRDGFETSSFGGFEETEPEDTVDADDGQCTALALVAMLILFTALEPLSVQLVQDEGVYPFHQLDLAFVLYGTLMLMHLIGHRVTNQDLAELRKIDNWRKGAMVAPLDLCSMVCSMNALRYLNPGAYVVLKQIQLPISAVMQRVCLGLTRSLEKWLLVFCIFAQLIVFNSDKLDLSSLDVQFAIGALFCLGQCTFSVAEGVARQYLVSGNDEEDQSTLSIWGCGIMSYSTSMMACCVWRSFAVSSMPVSVDYANAEAPFVGFTAWVAAPCLTLSVRYLLINLVYVHVLLGVIAKVICNAAVMIILVMFSMVTGQSKLQLSILMVTASVCALIYMQGSPASSQPSEEAPADAAYIEKRHDCNTTSLHMADAAERTEIKAPWPTATAGEKAESKAEKMPEAAEKKDVIAEEKGIAHVEILTKNE